MTRYRKYSREGYWSRKAKYDAAEQRRAIKTGISIEWRAELNRGLREVDKRVTDAYCWEPHDTPEHQAWEAGTGPNPLGARLATARAAFRRRFYACLAKQQPRHLPVFTCTL